MKDEIKQNRRDTLKYFRIRRATAFTAFAVIQLFVLFPRPTWAKNRVLHFEPETVELTGTIEQQTFPGRPGYESIKNGDEIERGWYLRLIAPIDVEVSKKDSDPNSMTERDVKVLHLTWDSNSAGAIIGNSVGKRVILDGHLFHALTAHHHSRVVMWVNTAKPDSK
ncbi:MAG: DUF4431 domain-containing protein [Deltaproteobacteria bacterium]|nr:DUF4431 domain-containing protein [Deltaproteobacteria bacterium]